MLQHRYSKDSSEPKYTACIAKSLIPFRCATSILSILSPDTYRPPLLRWSLESLRKLRLPAQPILPKDLRRNGEFFRALKQAGSHNDLVAEHGLVMVRVGSAVGTVVAVNGVAWKDVSLGICGEGKGREGRTGVAFVGVDVCFALCDLEVRLRGYLVESVFTAGEDFAGIAVAGNVDD